MCLQSLYSSRAFSWNGCYWYTSSLDNESREEEEQQVGNERSKEHQSDEREYGNSKAKEKQKGRRWADVYQFAFSEALTEFVEKLQKLQRCTKKIVEKSGWESEGIKAL